MGTDPHSSLCPRPPAIGRQIGQQNPRGRTSGTGVKRPVAAPASRTEELASGVQRNTVLRWGLRELAVSTSCETIATPHAYTGRASRSRRARLRSPVRASRISRFGSQTISPGDGVRSAPSTGAQVPAPGAPGSAVRRAGARASRAPRCAAGYRRAPSPCRARAGGPTRGCEAPDRVVRAPRRPLRTHPGSRGPERRGTAHRHSSSVCSTIAHGPIVGDEDAFAYGARRALSARSRAHRPARPQRRRRSPTRPGLALRAAVGAR